jgi:hypothetical protein
MRPPLWNESPAQWVERHFASVVIAADYQQILARRGVPTRRIVMDAAVARVQALDDGEAHRSAALDDPPTHVNCVVISSPAPRDLMN